MRMIVDSMYFLVIEGKENFHNLMKYKEME